MKRLDWKLEELERRRNIPVGTVAIQLLCETAKGRSTPILRPWHRKRVNSLIFGAVDYTKDMRVKITSEGDEQLYARFHIAVAARAAGRIAIDCPFVAFADTEASKRACSRAGRWAMREGC